MRIKLLRDYPGTIYHMNQIIEVDGINKSGEAFINSGLSNDKCYFDLTDYEIVKHVHIKPIECPNIVNVETIILLLPKINEIINFINKNYK
jgi:hypothetical protein